MGPSTLASGEASAAYGDGSNAIGKKSIATGSHAFASAENAIAIGNSTKAQANNTIAIGPDATANQNAEGSLVVGRGAVANATDVTVIGPVAQANGANATAVGRGAAANGTESTALGRGTKADGNQSVALGKGAQATVDSGVALGDSSVADRTARSQNGIVINTSDPSKSTGFNTENSVYAPVRLVDAPEALNLIKNTIKGNKGAVSVGDSGNTRQIINVAAGSADSDAVNVAQLKAVAGAIKHYDVVSPNGDITVTHPDPHDPNKTVWNLNLNPDRVKEITKWKLRNVDKDGNAKAGKTDALVKGDETVTFQDTDTIEVERVGTDGKTLKFSTKKNIKYFSVNSSGGTNEDNKGATVDGAIAIGKNASSTGSNAVSLGLGANASGANNTAIGPGAQAKDVRTTAIGYNANASEASAVGIGYAANATKVRSLAIGQDATTSANNAIALGSSGQHGENKTTASAEHAVAIGSGAIANIINGIALGSQSKTTQDKGQTGFDASQDVEGARTNKYDNLKNNVQNIRTSTLAGLSIGDTGKTRQINHLAAGTADDDAVNVAQLKSVNLAFKGDNNTKGDVRLHDQRLSVVGATNDFITTKANDNKLEIGTKQGTFSTTNGKSSSPKQGLATTTDVATTINQTYWQLQANGSKVGDVNPGDKVNIASGNGITVTPTTEANGVSKITISATVAGIKAGRNVTVETTDGVSTINAIDTNTQASVSKLNNNSPITIDSTGTNSAGAKDYKLDVNVDDKTITKEGGVLKAVTGNLNVNDNGNLNTPQKGSALVNATTLTNVVNNTYWKAAAGGNHADGKTNLPADKVKSSSTVTFNAGKNLTVDHSVANNFTFALNNTVDLTNAGSLTIGNTKVDNGGITITPVAGKSPVSLTANGLDNGNNKIVNVAAGENDNDAVNYKQLKDSISTETVRKADATAGDKNIVEVDPTAEAGKGAKGATYNIAVKESAVKNIAKTAVKVVDGKNTTVTPKDDATDNSKTYAVNVKGDLTDITSITNAAGSGKVEFKDNGVVNVAGNNPIKLDGKTGDITGLTNKTLDGENFAKSGRAATEEQLDIVNQKFNNKVSLGGDTGSTTEKALSNPGGIKFNVKAADGNKVVTTKAEGDNVNINFSGDEAAKVTSLSYKANKGTAKKVTLENGLDFTNGTHTTAEVGDDGVVKFNVETSTVTVPPAQPNTFTGKFEAPEKDGVATIKNVVDVVNNSGWKISQGAESKGIVKAGDEVSFEGGEGTTVTVSNADGNGKRTVTIASTVKPNEKGVIEEVTENGTGTNAPKKGQVKAKSGDDNKVTTVGNVANMINSAKWYAKAENSKDEVTDKTDDSNSDGQAMSAGDKLTLKAGKNLSVNRTNGVFTFALNNTVDLTDKGSLTIGETKVDNGGITITPAAGKSPVTLTANGLDNGNNKIVNVAAGEDDNDAVNYKQLKDTELHIAPTKANGQASGVTYTYDDETKSVTLKYKDGNGKVIENTEAKIDLSGLASKIKDYSFKTNATGSNLVGTGTDTTVASGKSVNFAASDNLTLKQDVKDGNVTYTSGLKNQVVVGEKGTPGADGKPGKDGIDGSIGVNGKDGSAVAINGKDGSIGLNGENGKNGLTIKGQDGNVGVDGKDGETRLVYVEKAAPTKPGSTDKTHELATLEDGMKYGGDIGEVANVKLNKQVDVKGGVTDKTKLSDNNIGVVSTPNATTGGTELTVKLAKELKGLTSAEFKNGDDKTKTEITHNGITITPVNPVNGKTAVTLTDEGLNNGGNKITHVAEGTDDNDAVNVKQLKTFKDEVGSYGWNLSVNNGKDASKITKDTTVDLNNDDGNIKIAKNGSNVTLSLGPDVGLGKAGKDGKDGSLAVRGKDGASVEISGKDGSIGLTGPKGKDGTPGASATITVEKGTTTVNDDRDGGKEVTRIVYTDKDKDGNDIKREVATLDDGLKFKGDSKEVINRKLGSQVNITGGADSTKLTENNIGVVYDKATNGLKVKLSKDVNLGDNGTITIGDTVVNKDGLTINGGPSVTKGGVNAGNQSVTNVKDGVADNDAVNVKQLKAAKTEVEAGDHINVTSRVGANGQTIYKVSAKGINDTSAAVKAGSNHVEVTKAANTHKDGSTTVTDYTVDLSKETKEDIKKGVDAHTEVTTKGLTFNADHGTTGVKKLGSKVAVNGDGKNITTTADENGVKVSMKDDIKVNSVTAKEVKVGDVNINENGINAGGKRITNVAPGKDGTDAVNVNQLKYVAGNISNQINNVDKGLRAGIAGALASGGLYHVTTAGKSMVSVGAGTYRGQNALAVGYSRLSDNGKVGVKFTVNSNSQGHAGASASVGYQW